jgi:hypothetical protein
MTKFTDLHWLACRQRCSAGEHDSWIGRALSARLSRLEPGERARFECEEELLINSPQVPSEHLPGFMTPVLSPGDF